MKNKYNKRRYKLGSGVQQIQMDTPDYSSAYGVRQQQNAKSQIGQNIGATAANMAMPGLGSALQGVGAISDAAFKDAKGNYKNKFSEVANTYTNPLATAGKAVSALTGDKTAAADLFSGTGLGAGLGALGMKNPFGKTTQEKVKEEAIKAEKETEIANFNKRIKSGSSTDAQSYLAKKGKYKVKSKAKGSEELMEDIRPIESEGREPVFGPKMKNGKRKLLFYNPDLPTHKEGGVPMLVVPKEMYNNGTNNLMPKAQAGKQKVKAKPKPIQDTDSWFENASELFDPTGSLSYDDTYRAIKNLYNNPSTEQLAETTLETLGALPLVGSKIKAVGKLGRSIKAGKASGRLYGFTDAFFGEPLSNEGFNYQKGTYKGRSIFPKFTETFKNLTSYEQGTSNLMPKRPASKYSLVGNGNMAVGAKQLKVNTLNDTALTENLTGIPAVNAANKFVQPTAGINQVARNIPEVRRKEKIRTPRSHKTANPDTNRIIDPPVPNELKPKPEKSHSKKVKVYR